MGWLSIELTPFAGETGETRAEDRSRIEKRRKAPGARRRDSR